MTLRRLADLRFNLLRAVGKVLLPEYRFHWPQLLWLQDEDFNAYLKSFGEADGMNSHRRWMILQLARLVVSVPGDTVECGVYAGCSSYLICKATQNKTSRTHFLFDSFEGLSRPSPVDGSYWRKGDLHCSVEIVRSNLNGSNLSFHPGWIPERFGDVRDKHFAFVHIDVDLYRPTLDSIEFFYPRTTAGGIVVCDDYGFTTCPGATKAIDDFLSDKPESMIVLPCGGGFLIKGTASESSLRTILLK